MHDIRKIESKKIKASNRVRNKPDKYSNEESSKIDEYSTILHIFAQIGVHLHQKLLSQFVTRHLY